VQNPAISGPRNERYFFSKTFLFPKMKMQLKRKRCQDVAKVHTLSQAALDTFTKRDFQRCFQ
jgi:hypothetical protein